MAFLDGGGLAWPAGVLGVVGLTTRNDGRVKTYSAPKDVAASRSDSPDRGDACRVEAVVPSSAGANDGMIENRGDDRTLPRQRHTDTLGWASDASMSVKS